MKVRTIRERLKKIAIKLPKEIESYAVVINYKNSQNAISTFSITNFENKTEFESIISKIVRVN